MKTVLTSILIVLFGLISSANFDPFTSVKVFFNDSIVFEGPMVSFGPDFAFRKLEISQNDTLHIDYFSDSLCLDCNTVVEVRDSLHNVVGEYHTIGTNTRKTVPFSDLLILNSSEYTFWYYEDSPRKKTMLFKFEII